MNLWKRRVLDVAIGVLLLACLVFNCQGTWPIAAACFVGALACGWAERRISGF